MVQLAPAARLPQVEAATNWAALAPVTTEVTGMAAALVLVTVTTCGVALVVPGSGAAKAAALGLTARPAASWPMTTNWLSVKVEPPPDTVTEFTPRGLPTTAWGVMPSPRKPTGAAGVTAGSHVSQGPRGPPRAAAKKPTGPARVEITARAPPLASVVKDVGGS